MTQIELQAGPDQMIVVYGSDDTGDELDPGEIMQAIAADAARRGTAGLRIVSMTTIPVRHAGAFVGRQGSGYETKASVVVVYATRGL